MSKEKKQQDNRSDEQILEEVLGPLLDWATLEKVDELEAKGGLMMPRESYIKQQRSLMLESFNHEMHLMHKSMEQAGSVLNTYIDLLPSKEKQEISEELKRAFTTVGSISKDPSHQPKEGKTLQDILKISNKTMLWIYGIGHECFIKNQFEESCSLFQFLVMLNSLVADYWIALGLGQRRLGWEDKALGSFLMAGNLNTNHPTPKYNMAEIYCDMGHLDQAQIQMDELCHIIKEAKHAGLRSSVQVLKDKIDIAKKAS